MSGHSFLDTSTNAQFRGWPPCDHEGAQPIFAIFQNHHMVLSTSSSIGSWWLLHGYLSSFGNWLAYQHLENLTMVAWFFFEGLQALGGAHRSVLSTYLRDSTQHITLFRLRDEYVQQF